jgi:lysozyme family protein
MSEQEEPEEMHEEVHHEVFEVARKAMAGKVKEFLAAGYPDHLVNEGVGLALASLQQVYSDLGTVCPDGVIGLSFGEPGDLWLELRDH